MNRPFKSLLGECWEDYMFKLTALSRQLIVDWVLEGYSYLLQKQGMIKRGFEVCDVTSTDPEPVRNDSFFKDLLRNVQEKMKAYECEFVDDDPFEFDECLDLDI